MTVDRDPSRRSFLLTLGATGIAAVGVERLDAQGQTAAPLWSQDYWAQKGAVKLSLFRKRASAPQPGEPPRPVLLLVHGSSNSGRSTFDLTVPGRGEYSMM